MKIAIIGAGFTGLAAAVELTERGEEVVVFEAEKKAGGMAIGFSDPAWDWSLERHYHHIFANDDTVIQLANKVGLTPFFVTPKTNSLIGGKIKQLDSPMSLLRFSNLSVLSRIRMGVGLLILKLIGNGLFLEKYKAGNFLPRLVGREGFEKVWSPLLSAKFGPYVGDVNMAWFWARVYKRTQALGYFEGGFQALADKTVEYIREHGGQVVLGAKVKKIMQKKNRRWLAAETEFDKVLLTVPANLIEKLAGKDITSFAKINYLYAQNTILELSQSLMDGYWLNILEKDFPFMVAVEQTNLVSQSHYGGRVLVYLGNYLPEGDRRLTMSEEKLIELYLPYLKKINPQFEKKWIRRNWCFETPFAQPVFPVNYSKKIPALKTDKPGLYVANMSMVYPWDRGTNYAVSLGVKAAKLMRDD